VGLNAPRVGLDGLSEAEQAFALLTGLHKAHAVLVHPKSNRTRCRRRCRWSRPRPNLRRCWCWLATKQLVEKAHAILRFGSVGTHHLWTMGEREVQSNPDDV